MHPSPSEVSPGHPSDFEWRAPLGAWRWVILGALGVGASGCGGQAGSPSDAQGGTAGSTGSGGSGAGGPRIGGRAGTTSAGGMGSGGTGSAGTGSGGGAPTRASACVSETALEGGLSRCENNLIHRVAAEACSPPEVLPESIPPEYLEQADAGPDYPCLRNADCTEGVLGRCTLGIDIGPHCVYGCSSDDDCAGPELCLCTDQVGGACVRAMCRTDAECGSGNLCAENKACSFIQFVCQIPTDECAVDADCPTGEICDLADFGEINPLASPAGLYRVCRAESCPIPGRPFLVAGVQRQASPVERRDWSRCRERAPDGAPTLAPDLRAAIVRGWTEQALMEHASVAAFARFGLQLLSVGAPPGLVSDAAAAMQDEIRHAQDCFRLARRHATSDIGPGPLAIDGALEGWDLAAIVLGTVREGCVGETLAALEAAEALQHCEDAAARPVLERIAAEETKHAELAWRFVAWALQNTAGAADSVELGRSVRAAFAAELAAAGAGSTIGDFDRELARHGLLSLPVRQALRARALREVVAPCAAALIEPVARDARTSLLSSAAA